MKIWCVMCCGCHRLLGASGALLPLDGGLISDVKMFETKTEADAAAQLAGWDVKDDSGPNHRCPDCKAGRAEKEDMPAELAGIFSSGRGAYIRVDQLLQSGGRR